MREYKAAVFIGRFQPFHKGHLQVLKHGLKIADTVVILVGSYHAARDIRNPWTYNERADMIASCLSKSESDRVVIRGIRDYYNNDNFWVRNVQNEVSEWAYESDSVAIIGTYKDASSYYFKYFPQWTFVPTKTDMMDSTSVRENLFGKGNLTDVAHLLPDTVLQCISNWAFEPQGKWAGPDAGTAFTEVMSELHTEFAFNKDYKERHQFRDPKIPYRPTFNTVDCVVVCSGHVLVVRRKTHPGRGLLALPGGFIKDTEKLKDAALRELKEETGIKVDRIILENSIVEDHAFDDPRRSLRGRTITHAYYIRLKDGELPQVRGSDDADKAFWMPMMDVLAKENEFFEDHCHIINYFINKGR